MTFKAFGGAVEWTCFIGWGSPPFLAFGPCSCFSPCIRNRLPSHIDAPSFFSLPNVKIGLDVSLSEGPQIWLASHPRIQIMCVCARDFLRKFPVRNAELSIHYFKLFKDDLSRTYNWTVFSQHLNHQTHFILHHFSKINDKSHQTGAPPESFWKRATLHAT